MRNRLFKVDLFLAEQETIEIAGPSIKRQKVAHKYGILISMVFTKAFIIR